MGVDNWGVGKGVRGEVGWGRVVVYDVQVVFSA